MVFAEELIAYARLLLDFKDRGIKCDKELQDVLGQLHVEMGFNSVEKNHQIPDIRGIKIGNTDIITGYIPPEALQAKGGGITFPAKHLTNASELEKFEYQNRNVKGETKREDPES